jgi:nicotinamidase-related amidase
MADAQGPELGRSALLIVDMQNDFVHPEGGLAWRARDNPAAGLDIAFLATTVPQVRRLGDAFRAAGRPVVYIVHVVKPDYSDAQFPYWRLARPGGNRSFIAENSWGARIVDELTPREDEHVVVKKGFGGFANTQLDTVLRSKGVTTCIVAGVMTAVCVSSTVRGGVEHNYRMIVVEDAVADAVREAHDGELRILGRVFADVMRVEKVIGLVADAT